MKEICIEELEIRPIPLFGKTWGVLTAGKEEQGFNAMTIAWGSVGTLWERDGTLPVCHVYVRPSRYTYPLMKENAFFTVSFLDESHRPSLAYLGSRSGRDDPDKIRSAGLSLVREGETAYIEGSDLVLICRKLYSQRMKAESFADKSLIARNYAGEPENIHEMFVGEIVKTLVTDGSPHGLQFPG